MRVLLGVCGGIAAYKAAEVLRALQDRGATVEVALTAAAERFVTPLTFNALSGRTVYTSLWSPDQAQHADGPIEHIAVAQAIDVLLIAPATAATLARLAHGLADDFLSTTYLATEAPIVIAPAMNVNMWHHPATQANVRLLRERGAHFVDPEAGYLACGMTGGGRLAPVQTIAEATFAAAQARNNDIAALADLARRSPTHDLRGETLLITAGGTREPLDPVRFLGNRSSGRMGYALAEAARDRGAHVLLITAATLPPPSGCEVALVETTAQMGEALLRWLPRATAVIGAAAVADFRPATPSAEKLRRSGALTLTLEPTPDLIAEAVKQRLSETLVIAFAAEIGTESLEAQARSKLLRKGVDAIVANEITTPGLGFDAESNAGLFLTPERTVALPPQSKRRMADAILSEVLTLRKTPVEPFIQTPAHRF